MSREDSSSTRHHNGSDDDKDRQLRRERRKLDKLRKKMKKAEQKSRKKSKKKSNKHKKRKHSRHRSTSSSSASASDDHAGINKRSRQVSPHVGRSDPPPSETQTSGTRQQVEAESQPASAPKPGSAEWFLQLSARESKTGGVGTVHVAKKAEYINIGTGKNPEYMLKPDPDAPNLKEWTCYRESCEQINHRHDAKCRKCGSLRRTSNNVNWTR